VIDSSTVSVASALVSVASAFRRKLRDGVLLWAVTWVVAVLLAIGPASRPAGAYAAGAPAGFTGGFGEQSCDGCHFDSPVNAKPGQLTITGVPERFAAGERYTLTITLSRPSLVVAGFQLAARFENGGAQAGTLAAAPGDASRVKIETQSNIQYVNQRVEGSAPAEPGTARWSLVWTAPQTGGTVLVHAAANAADKDGSTRGDFVYTAVATSRSQ
jgi:hypothetical protein